jgi:hypothetical protein
VLASPEVQSTIGITLDITASRVQPGMQRIGAIQRVDQQIDAINPPELGLDLVATPERCLYILPGINDVLEPA